MPIGCDVSAQERAGHQQKCSRNKTTLWACRECLTVLFAFSSLFLILLERDWDQFSNRECQLSGLIRDQVWSVANQISLGILTIN